MNRIKFIKGTIASGLAFFAAPFIHSASSQKTESTFDRLRENIGFNHVPNNEIKTMNTVLHKANTRGSADHGWLKVNHTFSFANYHNPERMHFGVLRVLNDDSFSGGKGFSTHPHDNMEIITIPLQGDLEHKDNMGNGTIIKSGDVQVMSAGTGITHSEFNASQEFDVKVLQIGFFPTKRMLPRDMINKPSEILKFRMNSLRSCHQMKLIKVFGFIRMRGSVSERSVRKSLQNIL
jgi:hypothetical protein